MADKKINIGLGFNVDKTNLNTLKTELQSLLNMSTDDLIKIGSENAVADLKEIQTAASAVQSALEKSFNPKLNTQDLTKFQQELAMSGQSISSIKAGLDKAGASGQNAFRNITTELLTTNRQLKQSNEWLDRMADTMANTVRWTVASSALNAVTGSIQKAYSFTKQLDTSLNDIRIVTGKSADEMARFAKEATTAAKNLGSTTTAYTKAALIYEQQGLGEADVIARSDVTTKVSNVTGQSAADVSEQLTAIWNGYKVSAAEAELYIDKVSAVAATTAADLEELSEGMGKVASAANSMGVDIDQLNASLATIISVTRQDASAVGTSLKTIYARMGDLAVDGEDEFGVKLGDVSGKLKTMGVDILDAQGQMREMGEVIEEVAEKWDTWTSAQQQAAAVALAGKRQYNNLIALFENWDMYEEAKSTSKGGAGELQKQQDIYMESMEAHLNQLQAEAEELYQTLLDPEGLNPLIDALTGVVGLVENLIESLGGGAGLLRTVGAIGFNVFGKQITKGITSTINNVTGFRDNLKQAAAEAQIIKELELTNTEDKRQQEILNIAKQRLAIAESMTEEEYNASNIILKRTNELYKQQDSLEEQKKTIESFIGTLAQYNEKGELVNAEEVGIRFESIRGELGNDAVVAGNASEEAGLSRQLFGKRERIASVENYLNSEENYGNQEKYNEKYAEYLALLQQESELQERIISTKADGAIESTIGTLEEYITASEEGNSKIELTVDKQNELKHILDIVSKAYDKNGQCITENIEEVIDAEKALKKFEKILDETNKTAKIASKDVDKLGKSEKKLTVELEESEAALGKLKKAFNLTKTVENVTKLVSGIANLGSGIETLIGLGDIWSNEDLTAGERLLQTFTSLSFALPQIITPINQAKAAMQAWLKQDEAWVAIQTTKQLLNKAENVDLQSASYWKGIYKNISSQLTDEEKKHFAALMLKAKAGNEAAIKEMKQIASEKLHSASLKTLTARFKEMGVAAWQSLGPYLPIVLAVVAAIGVLTAAVVLGTKAWNADAEAAKKATEASKALGDEYKQTKAAYEELKQSIADYKDAQTAIDELTVGTEEWRDAIRDANDKVLELIQNYPILAKYMSNENGRLVISDEGLEAVEQQKREATNTAFQKSVIAQQAANDAQLKSDATNLGRKAQHYTIGSVAKGYAMALNPLWYTIESAIKGDWNAYYKATTFEEIQDVASRAQLEDNADMWSSYIEFSNALEGYSKSQIDALWENSDELKALCEEIHANTEMNDALNATLIQTELADNQYYQNSEFQEGINQILEAEKKKVEDEALKKYSDTTLNYMMTSSGKTLMQEYANRMIASGEWKTEDVQVKQDKIVVAGQDKFVKNWDAVAKLLAEEDALNSIGNVNIAKLNNEIQKSVNSFGAFGKTLTQGAEKSKNVGEATSADYKKAQDALKNGLKGFTGDLDALGYEKISELEAALKKSVEDYEATSTTILANLDDRVENLLYNKDGTFVIGGLTLDQQRNYGEQMEAVYNKYGDSGVKDFNELFTSLGDKGAELAAVMSEVDSVEELDRFKKMLQEQGSLSADDAKSLVTTLQFSLGLFEEYSREAAQAAAANLNKVLNSVKNIGDTISPDEYDKLGEGMKTFFSITEDGIYALNVSASEFARQARIAEETKFNEKVAAFNSERDTLEKDLAKYRGEYSSAVSDKKTAEFNATDKQLEIVGSFSNLSHIATTARGLTPKIGENIKYLTEDHYNDLVKMFNVVKNAPPSNMAQILATYSKNNSLNIIEKDLDINTDGIISEINYKTLFDLYAAAIKEIGEIDPEYDNAIFNAEGEIKKTEAALTTLTEKEKEFYAQSATIATKEQLNEWVSKGYISEELAQAQAYRFAVEIDFGIGEFDQVDYKFDQINKRVDELQEKSENLFGDTLLSNLQQQKAELEDSVKLLASKQSRLSWEVNYGRPYKESFDNLYGAEEGQLNLGRLKDAIGQDIFRLVFDEKGRITNLKALEDTFTFHNPGITENSPEYQMFQAFVNDVNKHNANVDELIATKDVIEDQNELLKENALAILDHGFKTAHEINDIKKSYNDFIKEFSFEDDEYFSQGKIITDNYALAFDDVEKSMQKIAALSNKNNKNEDGTYTINDQIFTQEEMRVAILEEGTNLQEYALSLKESLTDLQELEIAQIEEIAEQYDNIVGYAESWNEFLEHGLALQELIHGENYEATKSWYEAQVTAVQSQLDTQKSEYAYWKNMVAEIEAETRNDYTYDEARAKMLESGKEVAATSAELGQMLYDNFERAWNSHFAGFERAKSEYEWISSQAERTFDAITGALESQKLINDWTKTMNETFDENAQKSMKEFIDLQEEKLKNLRTEGKLSQYNLDLAQAEFDLLQAKIALEDARNNKTQMRLTRGADGSYSYQYVVDDQAIAQAEGQVAEAAKNRLDIVKEEMDNQVNNFYDDVSALQNLLLEYTPDDISVEERAELNNRVKDIKLNLLDETGSVRLEADLREAVESAAAAAGIEGYENLSLEGLVAQFPEFKGYLDIINAIKEGKLETILEDGISSAGDLNDYLISLATTVGGSPSGTDGTLMGEIKDLLAGLTADELAGLGESIDGLEKISEAAQAAQDSFDSFATSIATVISNIKDLGIATQEKDWTPLIDTVYKSASTTSFLDTEEGEVVNRHNISISWSNSDIANLNESLTLGLQGTVKAMGELFSSTLTEKVSNISTSTKSISIQGVNLTFPAATSKEDIKDALEEWLAEIEQANAENSK